MDPYDDNMWGTEAMSRENRTTSGTVAKATKGKKTIPTVSSTVRHADNYGVEITGLEELADAVLMSELVLIMEHLKVEMAADNYFEGGEETA